MKKFFTLMALLFTVVGGASAQEVDIPIGAWTWNYNATTEDDNGVMVVTLTANYGQAATGWGHVNWSAYSKMVVVIDNYNNDWGEIAVCTPNLKPGSDWDKIKAGLASFTTITESTAIVIDLDPTLSSDIESIYIKGKATDDVIRVSRVYLVEKYSYTDEGTDIEFDQWGNILASAFNGYSDNAKVVFTVTAEGDATGVINWGIGKIASLDGSVSVGDLLLQGIGENTYMYTIADLKPALEAPENQYGQQGVNWNVWNQGDATCSRTSVKVYEVNGANLYMKTDLASFSSAYNLDFSDVAGLTAYKLSALTATEATLTPVGEVPAETGLVLEGTAGQLYNVPVIDEAAAIGTNYLNASVNETAVEANSTWVISGGALKLFTGTAIPAGKAYVLNADMPADANILSFSFGDGDDETTAIKNMKVGTDSNVYYDLSGRRVLYPTKGLYIVNGKKVILK